jgi:hypothetical protein
VTDLELAVILLEAHRKATETGTPITPQRFRELVADADDGQLSRLLNSAGSIAPILARMIMALPREHVAVPYGIDTNVFADASRLKHNLDSGEANHPGIFPQ